MSIINVNTISPSTGTTVEVTGNLVTNIPNAALLGTKNDGEITIAYANYVAKITQLTTGAPTALEHSNTMGGNIVWSRVGVGSYEGVLNGAFTGNQLLLFNNPLSAKTIYFYNAGDPDKVYIDCVDASTGSPVDYDGDELYIEIRVY